MRPVRIVYIFAFALSTLILLLTVSRRHNRHTHNTQSHAHGKPSALRTLFSLRSPLFPSSAIISLTDDNSTFFVSRPAAFGAELPTDGLSGQLWIGSGFGEDLRGWVGSTNLPEGELGCSDIPGWDETFAKFGSVTTVGAVKNILAEPVENEDSLVKKVELSSEVSKSEKDDTKVEKPQAATKDDGTDNYLFQPGQSADESGNDDSNADIQSLQESAEINGKVVLLSRGGCGFLDKAKWAQRRGGIALIVGDNMPGGPLVTMYARGDTSNITIPALFTSHTTAHLLSSLIPLKNGGKAPIVSSPEKDKKGSKKDRSQKLAASKALQAKGSKGKTHVVNGSLHNRASSKGLFKRVFSFFGIGRRSNSAKIADFAQDGQDDWVLSQDWQRDDLQASSQRNLKHQEQKEFVIGVQDWRNPDLSKPVIKAASKPSDHDAKDDRPKLSSALLPNAQEDGTGHRDSGSSPPKSDASIANKPSRDHSNAQPKDVSSASTNDNARAIAHEGLWVTLTPASMSSSPFFDTILVLVISPLVTLSVVYAVLLIRSRIRRRRWRAPKSVVDRLPVRTYHTIPSSSTSTTALTTPANSSPTTPLLQSSADLRPPVSRSQSRHRPRSRTTSEVPESSANVNDADDESLALTESARREKSLATWRRRYGGRQRECVVCLEEYINGVSRVMSLPCGHEFHVECITPWLTTRRRTCPICKGDVVRSMTIQDANDQLDEASSTTAGAVAADDDGLQARVANARNDSPSAHEPVPIERVGSDIERAQYAAGTQQQSSVGQWAADWWDRIRTNSWEIYNGQRGRGRSSRRSDDDPDRDR